MADKPEILDTRTVAQSQLFRVEAVDLRFSNGAEVTFERMRGSGRVGAVIIVPVTGDGTLKLIREYGVGTERYELGLPKGRVEPGEDMLVAANREIMEEIGYAAERLTPLRALSLAPGYFGHRTQVVLAEGLYPDPAPGDEPEPPESLAVRSDAASAPAADVTPPAAPSLVPDAPVLSDDDEDLSHLPPPPVDWDASASSSPADEPPTWADDPRASSDLGDGPPTEATPVIGAGTAFGGTHLDELRRAVSEDAPNAEAEADAAMAAFFDQDDEADRNRRFGRRR